jgi:hypothetical protein
MTCRIGDNLLAIADRHLTVLSEHQQWILLEVHDSIKQDAIITISMILGMECLTSAMALTANFSVLTSRKCTL